MAKKKIKNNGIFSNFETVCGIILALFDAIIAVAGLGGNNTGKGQMEAQTEKGSAYEWYKKSKAIGDADRIFDMANLFLQLCLVLGAISIVLKAPKIKYIIFGLMIEIRIIGILYTVFRFIASSGIL